MLMTRELSIGCDISNQWVNGRISTIWEQLTSPWGRLSSTGEPNPMCVLGFGSITREYESPTTALSCHKPPKMHCELEIVWHDQGKGGKSHA